ncbi:DUF116 domain-containing protein [Solidesulfovibrio sp.]|uniref:DUF116 domain-containing protein n=1 Tax=Solidesulfovibrio sp. TaxID=2910990 RepID=UPI002B201696|nr:DUF116 domain-containing protein [Solidesulfovibrio sp.]MEA5087924.1 DUF116 domain-containing protein [Solidesulfovibrio sp.]HML61767.1 DUF116 domain-containing protein [Solidesulfovibrio sp.]
MERSEPSRKRLFIGLLCGTGLAVCALLALIWIIPYVGLANIHPLAPWVLGAFFASAILLVLWATIGLTISVALGRSFLGSDHLRGVMAKVFLPLMTIFARLFRLSKSRVRGSFIKVNNEMVAASVGRFQPTQVLVLLPHCLQSSRCLHRLTYDINNCKRCGNCPVDGLITLSEAYGVHIAIATGGTIARRIVVQKRPRLILAVACERDLTSGIQDTYPIPVYGVLNERPNGPCLDTQVALPHLETALRHFLVDGKARARVFERYPGLAPYGAPATATGGPR